MPSVGMTRGNDVIVKITAKATAWLAIMLAFGTTTVWGQGQDSTPGERNLLIIAEMLPGIYSNANQALFDARRQLPDDNKHAKKEFRITRADSEADNESGALIFNLNGELGGQTSSLRMTLSAGPADEELSARFSIQLDGSWSEIRYCELRFRRRADHFAGQMEGAECAGLGFTSMQVSRNEVWVQTVSIDEPYWYERAREFHCYADLPGVSGGRDMPYERYDDIILHDKGATHWFTTRGKEKREIGLTLQAITWHVLNEDNGNFNRNSLVLYASEKMADGSVKSHPYTFTEPSATRIGYNLRWMLVNCAIVPRDKAKPEM